MSQGDLIAQIERSKFSPRFVATALLLAAQAMFEYFDFYIVGYLVAVLAPDWHLTYAQSSLMLLSAGVGSIFGASLAGWVADRFGRKLPVVAGGVLYCIASGAVAFIPAQSWILFSVLRVLVGVGMSAAITIQVPLILEFTPTRHRTLISSLMNAPISLGILLAASISSILLPLIGWRGLAALGATPILITIALAVVMPESARWLVSVGRREEARLVTARLLGLPLSAVGVASMPSTSTKSSIRELFGDRPRVCWAALTWLGLSTTTYGIQLWGPTLVSLLLSLPVRAVATYFVYISLLGTSGRILFSFLPLWIGRRYSAMLMGYGAAATTIAAALFYDYSLFGSSVFVLCLAVGAIFVNGGFANMVPYTVEVFPVRLAGKGSGLTQAANGVGKILGPLCLALIAGVGDVVTPRATLAALQPSFLFLGGCSLFAAVMFTIFRFETHGKSLALTDDSLPTAASSSYKARTARRHPEVRS